MAQPGHVILPVGIDERGDVREPLIGLVVIDDDHLGAERAGRGQCLDAGGAAVDGDDQLGAVLPSASIAAGFGP